MPRSIAGMASAAASGLVSEDWQHLKALKMRCWRPPVQKSKAGTQCSPSPNPEQRMPLVALAKSNCSAGLKSKNRPGGHRTLTRRKMQPPVLLKASSQSCGGRNCDVRKILSLRLHADLKDMLIWEPSAGKYFLATQHMVCGSLCGLCRVHQFICKYEAATKRLGFLKCFIACFATADCSVTMFAEQMNQKHNGAFQAFRSYHGSSACVGVCWHYPQHPHKSSHEYKLPAQQSEQSGLSSQKRSCARGTLHANACGCVRV